VAYPNLYAVPGVDMSDRAPGGRGSEKDELVQGGGAAASHPLTAEAAYGFNCVQRAHQNTLEKMPFFMAFTLLALFSYPLIGGFAALIFLLGRVLYAWGYAKSPRQRSYGNVGYLGQFVQLGVVMAFAVELFRGTQPY
jgi:uncharacterized MAPEG superfamily protein